MQEELELAACISWRKKVMLLRMTCRLLDAHHPLHRSDGALLLMTQQLENDILTQLPFSSTCLRGDVPTEVLISNSVPLHVPIYLSHSLHVHRLFAVSF